MAPLSDATIQGDQLQSQIGVSISLARSVVASWLPPPTEAQRKETSTGQGAASKNAVLINRRAPRAGLGATGERDPNDGLSVEELKLKRRLIHKEKKIQEKAKESGSKSSLNKRKNVSKREESSDDDEPVRKGQSKADKAARSSGYDSFKSKKVKVHSHRGFGR